MNAYAVKISENFKKMAIKSVWSILLFMLTYFVLIAVAVSFTLLCGYAGIMLIVLKPMFITLMLGVGLNSLGFLILFFLIKFMFNSNKIDRSHLIVVTEEDQPELFKFIREIVDEVQTSFPKNIYFSSEVNASVFYDSSFWSMFFPIRKNLQIGLGLMNSISVTELKAILAHEFGHFSQRSMKVGSYVYNVNKVIYNMLYDNDSYSSIIQKWANISSYFAIFVQLAVKIITGIQAVLKKVYEIVNINYMALSREMEFHADEVAAHVAGSKPLINSLLRLELADESLNAVFSYYNGKIEEAQKTHNLYPQQYFVMNFLAKESNVSLENGLPQVSSEHHKRFNKTKLVLKDQWSSHPSTEDRVAKLMALNKESKYNNEAIASTLLTDRDAIQRLVTEQIFSAVIYKTPPSITDNQQFNENYIKYYQENTYSDIYNGYFDNRNPITANLEGLFNEALISPVSSPAELFNEPTVDMVYTLKAITKDLEVLGQIESEALKVKTFDYDGQKYLPSDSPALIENLKKEQEKLNANLDLTDVCVFKYFYFIAAQKEQTVKFKEIYCLYKTVSEALLRQMEIYSNLSAATQFIQFTLTFDVIEQNMFTLKAVEKNFRTQLQFILNTDAYQPYLTNEIKSHFENYLSKEWLYFNTNEYYNDELDVLFTTMYDFYNLIQTTHFKLKKALLDFQISLIA